MNDQPLKYEVKPLSEMPGRSQVNPKFGPLLKAIVNELQPGWAIFVDHEKGSAATQDDIRKLQPRIKQAVAKHGCSTRSDFARMGVWVYKPEHLDAPLAKSDVTQLASKLIAGAR